jgi:hypothetical protein
MLPFMYKYQMLTYSHIFVVLFVFVIIIFPLFFLAFRFPMALVAKGFVRPFPLSSAKELFASFGELVSFEMNSVRSEAHVVFAESDKAKEALEQINVRCFPFPPLSDSFIVSFLGKVFF